MGERLVLTGFNYSAEIRALQAAAAAVLLPQVRDIRRMGSCALDLCRVAEGSADAYVEEGVSDWDHAAGGLVAREAGAVVELTTGVGGRDALVCAPASGFAEFRTLVTDCGFLAPESGIAGPR
jgi:myo-inositol-1(or 4)-monophosphatase